MDNFKPITNKVCDKSNFTKWTDEKYGDMQCFMAYVIDIPKMDKFEEIKANFEENATEEYIELQVSFDSTGVIREVIMLIQDKIEGCDWSIPEPFYDWLEPERIGIQTLDESGNVNGHTLLSEKEFTSLVTIANQAYEILKAQQSRKADVCPMMG